LLLLNNSEIRYTKIIYFPDSGCVHTLLTLYIYATVIITYDIISTNKLLTSTQLTNHTQLKTWFRRPV